MKLPQPPAFPEWQPALARRMIESGEFRFLNLSVPSRGRIPWVGSPQPPVDFAQASTSAQPARSLVEGELPRLWIYHLNYCDFLNLDLNAPNDPAGAALRAAVGIALDWCEQNSTGSEPGWEPYPLSLRVVNWLKFLARNAARMEALGEAPALARLLASLRAQVLALERRLEKDLLGNHLLKNIKALIFAGALLEVPESRRWWAKGWKLLRREIGEQILADGGHSERSPMYHALVLEDLLDIQCLSLSLPACAMASASRPATEVANSIGLVAETVARMARYLRRILHPDGEIPLFNDSALGVARPSRELLAYVEQVAQDFGNRPPGSTALPKRESHRTTALSPLGDRASREAGRVRGPGGVPSSKQRVAKPLSSYTFEARGPGATTDALADTGYAIIRDIHSGSCLVFDAGPLGPDHQPGHGHCDILSYELSLDGQRVVVDTGVSTYERGPERHYERSTAAHNTLRIDSEEQAEIWRGFRVGRRPRVGRLSVGEVEGIRFARGEYAVRSGVVHFRTAFYIPGCAEAAWVIVDRLRGRGLHRAESFIHFHPSFRLEVCSPQCPVPPSRSQRGLRNGATGCRSPLEDSVPISTPRLCCNRHSAAPSLRVPRSAGRGAGRRGLGTIGTGFRANRGSLAPSAETMRQQALLSFGRHRYLLMSLGTADLAVRQSWYSPEFGLRLPSHLVSLTWEGSLPTTMVHAFAPVDAPPPVVGLTPEGKAIEINGRIVPLA